MASRIKVQGIQAFDGDYPLDVVDQPFNAVEWRWIKQLSGYMPATIHQGFAGDDPDLWVAMSIIAMCRAGKITRDQALQAAEQLAEVPIEPNRVWVLDDDADPPAQSQKTPAQPANANGSNGSSGDDSTTTSENPEETPPGIGLLASATSATSGPETSET